MTQLFCFGVGYCAHALARAVQSDDMPVSGTSREGGNTNDRLKNYTFDPPGQIPDLTQALSSATHVLISIPPTVEGDVVLDHYKDFIQHKAPNLVWLGYLSTTGVYGDRAGGWVSETSQLKPTIERSARRLQAERDWQAFAERADLPLHIFRLAGLYGPGRNALLDVRAGKAHRVIKPGQIFSRIHVADVVQVLQASMSAPEPGAIYNVCDDLPTPPQTIVEYACELLGVEPPPATDFDAAEMSSMARSFYSDNKRVRNDRIKKDPGIILKYPTFVEGLTALYKEEPRS